MKDIKDRANAVRQYEEKTGDSAADAQIDGVTEEGSPADQDEELTESGSQAEVMIPPEDGEFSSTTKLPERSRAARIGAIIGLVIFLGLFIWLIVCIITGSKYTMAMLFCVIIYPIILYIMKWLKKVFSS